MQLVVIELSSPRRYPDVDRIPLLVLANPVLTPLVGQGGTPFADHDAITVYEGCLSVSGLRGRVRRPPVLTSAAFTRLQPAARIT